MMCIPLPRLITIGTLRGKALLALATLLLAGCAVGPDFKRPDAPQAASYSSQPLPTATVAAAAQLGEQQRFDPARDIAFAWWEEFHSAALNALVQRAFRANPDLAAAQAALRQAQENVIVQRGYFYPSIGVSYSPSRNKLAGNMGGNSPGVQGNGKIIQTYANPAGPVFNGPAYYNFHVAQLNIGYQPDVFGLNRRLAESAEAQARLQRFQLEATYVTLAANVVAAAVQEAALSAQYEAVAEVVQLNRELLAIVERQQKLGYASEADVATQQVVLSAAERALAPLQKQRWQARDLLNALVGADPDEVVETVRLDELHLPQDLPLTLPSKLVEQRPDVRAAEEQLHVASAQTGVAIAATLPQFALLADIGGMASTPDWMFRHGGGFFNLAANIAYTIFDGGSLRARSRAAQAALEQTAAQYRGTVIAALQNVADTLHTLQADAESLRAAAESEQANARLRAIALKSYQTGYASYADRLVVEQGYLLARLDLIQAQAARLGDSAALYQALGGGWWNRPADTGAPLESTGGRAEQAASTPGASTR
ncbi:efflux transporter outer membrane subunit [Ferriphaselus sp. R-1]|uniref:efflux transporter outer membrane subunit n=1 Tax=Ferriphaselus sp. R-1 TaxID=1485544 RepID=UPI001EFF77F4|nr:efflux transporter outer membrane subunit [Ferriphaselus sp. R-1]